MDDSELNDVFYFDDWINIRHFTDDDILEADEELHNILENLRKPRIHL